MIGEQSDQVDQSYGETQCQCALKLKVKGQAQFLPYYMHVRISREMLVSASKILNSSRSRQRLRLNPYATTSGALVGRKYE